ncbi:Glycosyltransferase involved in cell wall bisynthesis [Syntrophus gentianae]|uniref:Glycosyltransferase involved in cell wall bisynthesis n=1 Tax=Syntrophus gentianae TaxID=43775 RepID=A0A1H7V718_9BACT|nr:glycosyltransferase family 4 protein [Syntrophus gentianae]SEM04874.1 Glycosyltransferase involved in cell wall bisynthesis [Syntrophus gentianae]
MKIAIFTSYWNPPNFRGGISRVIFELRKEWQKEGHTVDIYACDTIPDKEAGIFRIPIPPIPLRGLWMKLYLLLFSQLDKYDILFPQSAFQSLLLDKKRCIPFVHTLSNVEHLAPWHFWKYAIAPLEKYALRNIRGCFTLDDKTVEILRKEHHVPDSKILKIYNGVDYNVFCPGPQKKQQEFMVLSAGRFIPRKRFDLLIRAFAAFVDQYGDAKLVIAGDGELKEDLRELVHRLHIDERVFFPGMVDESAMLELYRSASIFVLPSISEGMPMVVLEAQACSLPVVLAGFESARELVMEGKTGYIVKEADPKVWAEIFGRFYNQPELVRSFGEASRKRIVDEFGWSAVANRIHNHFQNILAEMSGI